MKVIALAGMVFVLVVYCPEVGRGFVKDDFTWIRAARAAAASPRTLILQQDAGFYRPLVTLTFALDYARSGWKPRAYGWTNLALTRGGHCRVLDLPWHDRADVSRARLAL
jgi:hypothetical protein